MSLHFRAVVLGVTIVGTICYAIYSHFKNRESEEEHAYSHGANPTPQTGTAMDLPTKCTICMSVVSSKKSHAAHFLECGHGFHKHCIQMWLISNNSCPNCRRTF